MSSRLSQNSGRTMSNTHITRKKKISWQISRRVGAELMMHARMLLQDIQLKFIQPKVDKDGIKLFTLTQDGRSKVNSSCSEIFECFPGLPDNYIALMGCIPEQHYFIGYFDGSASNQREYIEGGVGGLILDGHGNVAACSCLALQGMYSGQSEAAALLNIILLALQYKLFPLIARGDHQGIISAFNENSRVPRMENLLIKEAKMLLAATREYFQLEKIPRDRNLADSFAKIARRNRLTFMCGPNRVRHLIEGKENLTQKRERNPHKD